MLAFKEIRFPTSIAYGMIGGPEYSTDIVTLSSGREHRNINWHLPRAKYNISQSIKTAAQMAELVEFFRICKGRAYGFRFKDYTDYSAEDQLIGMGDGSERSFRLSKNYGSEVRIITKPVIGSADIFVGGKKQSPDINYTNGEIIFKDPPEKKAAIIASFEFDVPVRFDTDFLAASCDDYNSFSWEDINLIEIKIS